MSIGWGKEKRDARTDSVGEVEIEIERGVRSVLVYQ